METNNQRFPSYHLVGVAGVGMSALAMVLLDRGATVSGSDRSRDSGEASDVLDKLCKAGLRLTPQDGSGINEGLSAAVFSSAVEKGNPDFIAARRLTIPIVHRAEMLAWLARGKRLVAVAGTSGKTTVTGMIGWILERFGMDPTVVNGGAVLNWVDGRSVGNVRLGRSDLWVVEVDESDRSLMRFDPEWVVVTNISKDHFEVSEAESLFRAFAARASRGVAGVLGDAADRRALEDFKPVLAEAGSSFEYGGASFDIPLPGAHNAENALCSAMICAKLGVEPAFSSRALASFKGIHRRLELVGAARGITVIDDYAHNPAKIEAAWRAVKPFHERVIAVWRPHGYGPLALLADELATMFGRLVVPPDVLYLLPVFYAGGTAQRSITSEEFAQKAQKLGANAEFMPGYAELMGRLMETVKPGDAVLFMGARDPGLPVFARSFFADIAHLLAKRKT